MRHLIAVIALMLTGIITSAQQHKETITKEVDFPITTGAVLVVENIFGDIEVEGYNGDTVILEVEKEFSADDKNELEESLKKVFLTVETRDDTVDIFLGGVCGCQRQERRNQNWNQCNFKFNFDFKVKVPKGANINVSTVNDGEVDVQNLTGEVIASNVNGGINARNISGPTNVHTINGNVEIRYAKNPTKKSSYYSLNGDVNVYYYPNLSAEMRFKSFQGDMFTNFDIAERLPPVLSSTSSKNKSNTTYRIENKSALRVGKGGVILDFETFNGDVYIRKI